MDAKGKNVTIVDVAERAGVSKTTVSRYLNGKFEFMSEESRSHIAAVIESLGYRPNNLARGLKSKRTRLLGVVMGNVLPARLVSALSVALYGMFLAIIIPPARRDKVVGALVALSFAASYFVSKFPLAAGLSAGTRTILLTLLLSGAAAVLFPVKEEEAEHDA